MLLARGADMSITNMEHGHAITAEAYAEKQGHGVTAGIIRHAQARASALTQGSSESHGHSQCSPGPPHLAVSAVDTKFLPLVDSLLQGNTASTDEVAAIIAKLAARDSMKGSVAEAGAVAPLMLLLKEGRCSATGKHEVCMALVKLVETEDMKLR